MNLENLYDILYKEVSFNLIGTLIIEEIGIKWEYNCINDELELDETDDEYLTKIYLDDFEIIRDSVNLDKFNITEPIIEDTYISFYIEE